MLKSRTNFRLSLTKPTTYKFDLTLFFDFTTIKLTIHISPYIQIAFQSKRRNPNKKATISKDRIHSYSTIISLIFRYLTHIFHFAINNRSTLSAGTRLPINSINKLRIRFNIFWPSLIPITSQICTPNLHIKSKVGLLNKKFYKK